MLSDTLNQGLIAYGIGDKLRALRLRKKMGLVELGRHTALSPALLSKVERGRMFPTLPTLLRIALVFSVGLDYFFADDRRKQVLAIARRKDRRRFPDRPGAAPPNYVFECLDFSAVERKLNAYYAEFRPVKGDKPPLHQHAGVEFLYVMRGRLGLWIRDQEHHLDAGDSVYFDSSAPHGYRRAGTSACAALVVTTP